jgi:hypothetical protein
MKAYLSGIIFTLALILVIGEVVMVSLLVKEQAKVADLQVQYAELEAQLNEHDLSGEKTFEDKGLGVSITLTERWSQSFSTVVDPEIVIRDQKTGRLLTSYQYRLLAGSTELIFSLLNEEIVVQTGSEDDFEIQNLGSSLMRMRAAGQDTWQYVEAANCSEFTGIAGDFCYRGALPGLDLPIIASLINADLESLGEVDASMRDAFIKPTDTL